MSFTEDYLYSCFEKKYAAALSAKDKGRLSEAKSRLYEAADYLTELAACPGYKDADTMRNRAERIKAVAAAITPQAGGETAKRKSYSADSAVGSNSATAHDVTDKNGDTGEGSPFYTFFDAGELTEGFEKVIGLEKAKEAVIEYVINPIRYKDAYNYKFTDNKAVLLEGPPGTGKTTFAKAVAKEINQPFALINVAALVNCYVGETAKNIDAVFEELRAYSERKNCGLTVFFDELDEIAKKRTGDDKASASSVPALLRNLDGMKRNKDFLILANTNCMELLDSGILDRFRKRIHIPLPDLNMRTKFFESKLSEIEDEYKKELDFALLGELSEGMSGRGITYVCDDFKYYVGGVKAGIKDGRDLNGVLGQLINENKGR